MPMRLSTSVLRNSLMPESSGGSVTSSRSGHEYGLSGVEMKYSDYLKYEFTSKQKMIE